MSKKIAFHITCNPMSLALLAILRMADNEGASAIPEEFKEPYWLVITPDISGEDSERLPTAENYDEQGDPLSHLEYADIDVHHQVAVPPADYAIYHGSFVTGLATLLQPPKIIVFDAGGYTALADGSGRISVGCQAFTVEEADELVKLYDKYKDRLPDKGDVSPDLDVGDFEVTIRRDDRMRLIVEIDGESIMGKYISLLDRFRKDPEKVKAELTN